MNEGRNPCHPHRHKSHCIYYEGCHTEYCRKIEAKCFGSMLCEWYTTSSNGRKKSKNKDKPKSLAALILDKQKEPNKKKWNCRWFKKKEQLCTKYNRYYQLECDKCEYWNLGNYKEPNQQNKQQNKQQKTTKNKKGPKKMSSRRLIQRPSSSYYRYRF